MNEVKYTAKSRFFTHGNIDTAQHLVYVLHGYGQMPEFFIRKFKHLNPEEYFVVAPEGPHRFYQTGTNGRVGASWMTKENREMDIENYLNYLTAINSQIKLQKTFQKTSLIGFSQGGATASRWHGSNRVHFDNFILWAAVFPPDMPLNYQQSFAKSENHFVFGTRDEYYTMAKVNEHLSAIKKLGLIFDFHTFEGNHNIDADLALTLLS